MTDHDPRPLGRAPVDLRPTAETWRPQDRSAPAAAIRYLLPLALVGFGIWSYLATPSDGEPLWVGVGLGVFGALVVVLRLVLRSRPERRDAMVAKVATATDHSGAPLFRTTYARSHYKRIRTWSGGQEVPARILAIEDLYKGGTADRSLIYLELEFDLAGTRYRAAAGEYVRPVHSGVLVPDAEIIVRVDPDDPTLVAIDWTQTMRAPDAR